MLIVNPTNMTSNPSYDVVVSPILRKRDGPTALLRLHPDFDPDAIAEQTMKEDTNGRPYLHHACFKNHFTVVQGLLQCGASLLLRTWRRNSVLIFACCGKEDSRADMIAWLLLHHKDARSIVNCRNTSGMTPLHIAAGEVFTKGVIALLNHGADVTLKDNHRHTADVRCTFFTNTDIKRTDTNAKETKKAIKSGGRIISAGEWRPNTAGMFPRVYRYAMRTLVCLAKAQTQ